MVCALIKKKQNKYTKKKNIQIQQTDFILRETASSTLIYSLINCYMFNCKTNGYFQYNKCLFFLLFLILLSLLDRRDSSIMGLLFDIYCNNIIGPQTHSFIQPFHSFIHPFHCFQLSTLQLFIFKRFLYFFIIQYHEKYISQLNRQSGFV